MIKTRANLHKRQRGVSLPVALILLVPLTLLGITLANRNNLEELMAASQRDGQQSLMNAETGLALGDQILDQMVKDQIEAGQVVSNESDSETGTNTNRMLTLADPYTVVAYGDINLSDYSLDRDGEYQGVVTVVVMDNDDGDSDITTDVDNRIILRSIGSYGAYQAGERIVEAIVHLTYEEDTGGGPDNPITIFTEDKITFSSTAEIRGPAIVHSNVEVEIGGEMYVEGEISNAGSSNDEFQQLKDGRDWPSGYAKDNLDRFGDDSVTTVAAIETPFIYPPYYKGYATRYLTKNCQVWNGVPDTQGATSGWPKQGWLCSSGDKWELKGYVDSHFYYVESHVIIDTSIGSDGIPFEISIVSEGYMDVSAETYIVPYPYQGVNDINQSESDKAISDLTDADKDKVLRSDEVLLLAGGDLLIQGQSNFENASASFHGLLATHDQIYFSGTIKMHGGIIAENRKYTGYDSSLYANVKDGQKGATEKVIENLIKGELFITGNVNMGGGGKTEPETPLGANFEGWREVIE